MIKAEAIDLGGVLFSEGKSVATTKLAAEHGYDKELISRILGSVQATELRKGNLSDDAFWHWAQREIPSNYDALLIKKAWYDGYVLDEGILALMRDLKGKYRLIAFSGNISSRIEFLENKYSFKNLFDIEIYSFDYHLMKPDKKFIEVMIAKSACRAEEIIYIDDNEAYAQPARELGVSVLLYSRGEAERLRRELRKRGLEF